MVQQKHFGESAEMYLKSIAELSAERRPVPVTSIAGRLGIATVSASEMIHRLQDRGLVEHTPYKGVHLTQEGTRRANIVIRRHRLWECLLVDKLEIPWERVHEYACRLEHATDEEVIDALGIYLDQPKTCPHGNPIPSPEGEMPPMEGVSLVDLTAGEAGKVLRILPEDDYDILCGYLAARGIKPGVTVAVEEIAPFEGPISVRLGEEIHALGRRIAAHVVVEKRVPV
ncbi:MAG: metal-dependent transcriptional regulator [Anaerolineales bacterium]|nr:metal-dependent transcriptional regulator [Anaerolineales bacterium]